MGAKSQIEWTEATWEPITGCSKCSRGCDDCYAIRLAAGRLRHHRHYSGLTQIVNGRPNWTGDVRFNEDLLAQPLRWRQAKRIFVCSRGDLFHPQVRDEWLDRIFKTMADAPQHTYQILTKRPERMRAFLSQPSRRVFGPTAPESYTHGDLLRSNVWLGTSVEDQEQAEKRIPELLATPGALHWLSIEPLLSWMDISQWTAWGRDNSGRIDRNAPFAPIQWVIVGGESGPRARPMNPVWVRVLRDRCAAAGVPFYFKQWGEWVPAEYLEKGWTKLPAQRRNATFKGYKYDDGTLMLRVGKRCAGRLLDGVEHREYPKGEA